MQVPFYLTIFLVLFMIGLIYERNRERLEVDYTRMTMYYWYKNTVLDSQRIDIDWSRDEFLYRKQKFLIDCQNQVSALKETKKRFS